MYSTLRKRKHFFPHLIQEKDINFILFISIVIHKKKLAITTQTFIVFSGTTEKTKRLFPASILCSI